MRALNLLLTITAGIALPAFSNERPPNILLILTDDQGFGDVSIHGNQWVHTPNMDRIATEGARFERFFVSPVCAPTRAALLSGRNPTRTGVFGVTRGRENMRGEEVTLAELLRDEAGYATGCFGKWHNGPHWPYHPNAQGFDEFVGFCGGHWNDYFDPLLERNGEPFQARGFIADILTEEAMRFIRGHAEEKNSPFFCYLPYNTPHTPASVPVEDWKRWADHPEIEDEFTRAMYALCENLDRNIGRLLALLGELKIESDTLVIFMTDNGPNGERFNDGMLGRKGSEHEGGIRVPLFVRWPGRVTPGAVIPDNAAHIDLLPTLCAIAGIEHPASHTLPLDGIDLSPRLLGQTTEPLPERCLFTWRTANRWSVRSSQYRATAKTLHDLKADPGQKVNLAKKKPEVHQKLVEAFRKWAAEAVPESPVPAPVHIGNPDWPRVTVKAHEFEVHPGAGQGIDYCGPQGYANQWIERWTDPEAYADCPLRAIEDGKYLVTVRYACDPESAGSRFRLQAGDQSLDFAITEPWISAPWPAPEQGPQNPGGYLSRDWIETAAGEIAIAKGEYSLELRALSMKGSRMPDIKAIRLERVRN